ncbi:MAG: amine dehydrogenase large subunit, partial [Geminicoccaceae bacterium]
SNRLFVNMHEGTMWTHKHPGEEVWVFDLESKQRLERIPTEHGAFSSIVTQDDQPLLFTLSETQTLSVFDGTTYEHQGDVGELGISPYVLYVTGE